MKNKQDIKKLSVYISYILRHNPSDIGLELMDFGYLNTEEMIKAINNKGEYSLDLETLRYIVSTDEKKRYSFKAEGSDPYKYIRANQGHSIKGLIMDYKEVTPPEYLYHGTSSKAWESIQKDGMIKPMSRQMVHLSRNIDTAKNVGDRHSKSCDTVILRVNCNDALADGVKFYLSDNGVYLVEKLEIKYVEKI